MRSKPGLVPLAAVYFLMAAASLFGRPAAVLAQDPSTLVDRIVAVVGDTAVLQSELQEFVFQLVRTQGVTVPQDPERLNAFLRQALDQKVNQVLFVIHAQREQINVTAAELDDYVDQELARVRGQFDSEAEFQQALASEGVTVPEYRIRLSEQIRAELLTQRYLQTRASGLPPVPVSEEEIRDRFELQKQGLGTRPATVTLKQVVINPGTSDEARLIALEEAERLLSRARSGEDFTGLARDFSDDPGTRDQGGDLGWMRRGDLVPQFADVLFDMEAGEISDVVETMFGYHIIKLERIRDSERQARHILIRPENTEQDSARADGLAEEVADALRAGADIDSLIPLYGDPTERSSLTDFARSRLPPEYRQALEGAEVGDIRGPFRVSIPGVADKWVVVKLLGLDEGGEWTLDEARDGIRRQLQQEKLLERVVRDLRESTYIDMRFDDVFVSG